MKALLLVFLLLVALGVFIKSGPQEAKDVVKTIVKQYWKIVVGSGVLVLSLLYFALYGGAVSIF